MKNNLLVSISAMYESYPLRDDIEHPAIEQEAPCTAPTRMRLRGKLQTWRRPSPRPEAQSGRRVQGSLSKQILYCCKREFAFLSGGSIHHPEVDRLGIISEVCTVFLLE